MLPVTKRMQPFISDPDVRLTQAGENSFQDPIYACWLKTEYFAKNDGGQSSRDDGVRPVMLLNFLQKYDMSLNPLA